MTLHRRYREAAERSEAMAAQLGDDWIAGGPARMPYEQVRDFFYAQHNHIGRSTRRPSGCTRGQGRAVAHNARQMAGAIGAPSKDDHADIELRYRRIRVSIT